jgi:hypothetical protein
VGSENPEALATLAAAFAETGRFPEAIATAEAALQHAEAHGMGQVAGSLRGHLTFYRAGQPIRE